MEQSKKTSNTTSTGPSTTNNRSGFSIVQMLDFVTILHQLTGDLIKVYSGQCPCRHSVVSTDTNNIVVEQPTIITPPVVQSTSDGNLDNINMNCHVIISQMTNLDRLLDVGVPTPSIISSSSSSSLSIVRPPAPSPPRSLSLPLAPTPPLPVVQPPPPLIVSTSSPPLLRRLSLRPRPTKKPKRLNVKHKKTTKKQTNNKKKKQNPDKLKLPTARVNKHLFVKKYIDNLPDLPEAVDSFLELDDSDFFATPSSGGGDVREMDCESLVGLGSPK